MIRQQFVVDNGQWKCAGCAAAFLPEGVVEHPAGCPQLEPVRCKHDLLLESCAECMPRGPRSVQDDSAQSWADLHYVAEHTPIDRYGPWIIARYNGVCGANFNHKIESGEYVRADDDLGEFVCTECGIKGGPPPE